MMTVLAMIVEAQFCFGLVLCGVVVCLAATDQPSTGEQNAKDKSEV